MIQHKEWLNGLSGFQKLAELRESDFFRSNQEEILAFLQTPQTRMHEDSVPLLKSFIRVVQWNIEKGKRLDSVLTLFRDNEVLKWADVIILNEADHGMNRSGNRHVSLELAEQLGMHMVFGPAHFELTKGTDDDLAIEGENRESLQGNAVLSRYPVIRACIVPLPVTFEPYEFQEKRFGRRCCLWVQLKLRHSTLWVGSVHLELRNTPRCRAQQMEYILDNLPDSAENAFLLGGDMNVNSFRRGTAWRTVQSVFRILLKSPENIKDQLLHPEKGLEPLFQAAGERGFSWDSLNSNEETARTAITALEESRYLPGWILRAVQMRLKPYDGYLCFKLDWFLGKHLKTLTRNKKRDDATGTHSVNPGRVRQINYGPKRISDHLPIYVDLATDWESDGEVQ